ncbi:Na/Pi cotransporter family protein [Algoriphagus sp.]|uniref:Na/Pi cotransporter family protein n=1 Tax=Algoriphagus sp. TaxID=1872435 RepID=UPI00271C70BB|nr:Na/Pi symporter [Algoriphagus sp.]MDO8967622.1 Na/Pi symporter [Algoriphagus sp.]MDP3198577.1 Na/Pi symporter [Algoriphagus sp.]
MDTVDFEIWMFIAGLGIFLFGMFHLETGLKGLAGNSFKKLLQRFTDKRWKGILTGSFVTAILQSSSLVTLLVLAFLGAGMISLQNSLGVVFGANLGTTVTAWIVATVGFKLDIADLSYPFLAIGSLSYLLLDSRPVLKNWGSFLIGFGLLFLGLDFMKTSIEDVAGQVDLSLYANVGLWIFLLIGLVTTVLIQSSSAMIVIVLSALNAELISIHQSVAMIIGANIGTTSTLIIASFNGTADKKRLAAANVIFNLVAGAVSFLLLRQMVYFTIQYLGIREPLLELVFLNTLINLIGIVLFFPFIPAFARFMNRRFVKSEPSGTCRFIKNVDPEVSDVALQALDNEISRVYTLVEEFILDCLLIDKNGNHRSSGIKNIFRAEKNLLETYAQLKSIEDEITDYYTQIQRFKLTQSEADLTANYLIRVRSMIIAAKNIKDVIPNIKEMSDSEDPVAVEILGRLQDFAVKNLNKLSSQAPEGMGREEISKLQREYEDFYILTVNYLYKNIPPKAQLSVSVSSITNAIRKIVSALEELITSVNHPESTNNKGTEPAATDAGTLPAESPVRPLQGKD